MGQETTFVLIGQPQFSIFDKSCIFISCHFKQIIKKFTGSKSKDYINLTTSPLDFWTFKMYILTPKFSCIGESQAKLYIFCIFGSGHFEKTTKIAIKT